MKISCRFALGVAMFGGLIPLVVGCGAQPSNRGTVQGQVTLNKAPLNGAMIYFQGTEGGPETRATVEANGRFEVRWKKSHGLPPGKYKVAIQPGRIMGPDEAPGLNSANVAGKEPKAVPAVAATAIPEKYQSVETSGFTATVNAGANPDFVFDLVP